jgi:hypothetical protein
MYYKDEVLTNGLHDELWINGARALPAIKKSIDNANAIACAKELYAMGSLSKDGYEKLLVELLLKSGYELKGK